MKIELVLPSFLKNTNPGFTLLEAMIVVIIIGILAAIGYVNYGKAVEKARSAEAYQTLSQIVSAEQIYYVENNAYTNNFANLHTFEGTPTSANFTYSIPSTNSSSGYTQAARSISGGGRLSYGMCLRSGKKAGCDADICDPGCP